MKIFSRKTLAALKKESDIFNSRLKRGEIEKPEDIPQTYLVYCGCGDETCCFMGVQRKKTE